MRSFVTNGADRPGRGLSSAIGLIALAFLFTVSLGSCGGSDAAKVAPQSATANVPVSTTAATNTTGAAAASDGGIYPEDYEQISLYWLKQYVQLQVPALADPNATDWAKVNALREWTYGFVDSAAPACLLDNDYGPLISHKLAFAMQLLLDNRGGFYCSGTAYVLTGLYRLFGFTSYVYNMGQPEGPNSHAVSLVKIQDEGRNVLSVQDAFLGFTLEEDGKPLDFERLLDLLASRRADKVEIDGTEQLCKPAIFPAAAAAGSEGELRKYYTVSYLGTDGRVVEYCYDLNLETLAVRPDYSQWIASQTGEPNFLYIFLLPLGTSGEAPAEALAAKSRETYAGLGFKPR